MHKIDPRYAQEKHVFARLTQSCAKLQCVNRPRGPTPFVFVRVKPKYVIRTSESSIEKIALAVPQNAALWQTAQPALGNIAIDHHRRRADAQGAAAKRTLSID